MYLLKGECCWEELSLMCHCPVVFLCEWLKGVHFNVQCMENISLSRTDGETSDLILTETVVFIRLYHHHWVVICLLFTLEAVPRLHLCSLECVIQWIFRKKCLVRFCVGDMFPSGFVFTSHSCAFGCCFVLTGTWNKASYWNDCLWYRRNKSITHLYCYKYVTRVIFHDEVMWMMFLFVLLNYTLALSASE